MLYLCWVMYIMGTPGIWKGVQRQCVMTHMRLDNDFLNPDKAKLKF
jgi:hypothetical protein